MPQRRKISNSTSKGSLLFISDLSLRKKIENAIETMAFLYLIERNERAKEEKPSPGFLKEIYRMIILYSASVIEAVLLYLYKKKSFSLTKPVYKNVHTLPSEYQLEPDSKLVFARQKQEQKDVKELMLDILLKTAYEKKVIKKTLSTKIEKLKNVRNTFHLSKSRKGIQCSRQLVNESFKTVLETVTAVQSFLSKP